MPGFELFGEPERKHVNEVLETGVLMRYGFDALRNGCWKTETFEKNLAEKMQVKHALSVSSGTAALTVALASAGIGAGDEVIMPVFTFVASFEAVLALGAVPVLTDIDDTLTLDPEAVKKAITPRTKAVMPVHMCGSMADLKTLKHLCDTRKLLLIEDTCQAIGGKYAGRPLGSYGDIGCFSFDFVKTITCGEGGALITNNDTYAENAHKYADHGHDHTGNDRGLEDHPFMGYNYRISELHAAVGVAQLARLDEFIALQKKNYLILREALGALSHITFRRVPGTGEENYSFLSFFLPDESRTRKAHKALSENGIDGCFYWYHNNWHYVKKWEHLKQLRTLGKLPQEILQHTSRYQQMQFPTSDYWMSRTLSALIKLSWSADEVQQRAEKMVKLIKAVL